MTRGGYRRTKEAQDKLHKELETLSERMRELDTEALDGSCLKCGEAACLVFLRDDRIDLVASSRRPFLRPRHTGDSLITRCYV